MKYFILSLITSSILFASTSVDQYRIGEGKITKTGVTVPIIMKYNGQINDAKTITVTTEEKDALEMNSKFDCKTGNIDIDAAVLDIPDELDRQFKEMFSDTDSILKELAYQEVTELLLDEMAKIHYNMTAETGGDSLKAFEGLSIAYTEQCIVSVVGKSVEISLEGGAGFNVYDLFSGKFGFNAAELAGITKCLRNSEMENMDDKSKERYEESKRWVRHLFYKILNESMDINLNTRSAECKEFDKEKSKRDEIGYNLACKGVFIDLTGNSTNVEVTGEQVVVGTKKTSFKEQEEKGDDATKKEKQDKEAAKDKEANDKKDGKMLAASSLEYEGIVTKTPAFKVKKNTIDILDFSNEERLNFNIMIYLKAKKAIESKRTTNKKVQEYTIEALRRLLSTTKIDENVYQDYKCSYIGTPEESCKEEDFPFFKGKTPTEIRAAVKKRYENQLKEAAINYNTYATGLVSLESLHDLKEEKIYKYGKDFTEGDYEKDLLALSRKNLDYWHHIKDFVFGGSGMIFLNEYTHYDKDYLNVYKYVNDHPEKINNATLLLQPQHELETARMLFSFSRSIVKIKLLLAQKSANKSYTISQDPRDIEDNFSFMDANKMFVLTKSAREYYGLTTKELEEVIDNIRYVKNLYVSEYIEVLSKRMDSIRAWLYNFNKKGYNNNDAMIQLQKLETKKILLKIEQRKRILEQIRD